MKKHIVICVFICICLCSAVLAQRKSLEAPKIIRLDPKDSYTQDFRRAYENLLGTILKYNCGPLLKSMEAIGDTLDQAKLEERIKLLEGAEEKCPLSADRPHMEVTKRLFKSSLGKVLDLVSKGQYVDGAPISVSTDKEKRRYVISWKTWSGRAWDGPVEERFVNFVPVMEISVVPKYKVSNGKGRYSYRLINSGKSRASTSELVIECYDLNSKRLKLLQNMKEKLKNSGVVTTEWGRILREFPDTGYMQDFTFDLYKPNRGGRIVVKPGSQIYLPDCLEVPWGQLPGIVQVWADVTDYSPGLSGEYDPPNAWELFSTHELRPTVDTGMKKVPKYMYHGFTVGPVPCPEEEITRSSMIAKIIAYLNQARILGWVPNDKIADNMVSRLKSFAGTGDVKETEVLLEMVTAARERGDILEEAEILLKYNLLYISNAGSCQ